MSASASSSAVDEAAHLQALQWQVVFWSGEATQQDRARFSRWLGVSGAHQEAWNNVERVSERLHQLPTFVGSQVLRAPRSDVSRRSALRILGVTAGVGVAAYAAHSMQPWSVAFADHRAATGEQKEIALPDGSRVTLNTGSALDVRFNALERRVVLLRGEIFIVTAPDAIGRHRPFIVETTEGSIQAIGTQFNVRRSQAASQVGVVEGAVNIVPSRNVAGTLRLNAGEKTQFDALQVDAPTTGQATAPAWTRGLLIAERMPLADFVAELSRYRDGVLRCDADIAQLIVSGVYSLRDTDRALEALCQALPVRVSSVTRYWATVKARPA